MKETEMSHFPTELDPRERELLTFREQAQRRCTLYREKLHALGLMPGTPMRFIALLTSGLPGEALEVAVVDEQGRPWTRRARPLGEIESGARKIHGLNTGDLAHEALLTEWKDELLSRLSAPTAQGSVPVVVAWTGGFVARALSASLGEPFPVALVDVQAAVREADLEINPDNRYRPSLAGLQWTVEIPVADPTRSLSAALAIRVAVYKLLAGEAAQDVPSLQR